jgi:hypothetical protein
MEDRAWETIVRGITQLWGHFEVIRIINMWRKCTNTARKVRNISHSRGRDSLPFCLLGYDNATCGLVGSHKCFEGTCWITHWHVDDEYCQTSDYSPSLYSDRGTRRRNWLRHYATSRKVAGSIPDVIRFFNLPNPSSRAMALGSNSASNRNEYQESSWG